MLAIIAIDAIGASADSRTSMARVFATFVREHEIVMTCPGISGSRQLVADLQQEMPRFRFVTMVVDGAVAADLEVFADLLDNGIVPIAAVPDGQARTVARLLADRLDADTLLFLAAEYPNRQTLRTVTVSE